ncbi:hypothetical protein ACFL13_03255, partial [Patescibacteria group bacterium]
GSFSPAMIVNLVIPFIFRRGSDYIGVLVHREYLMHETYVYIGISSFLIALFGHISMQKGPIKRFCSILVGCFLVLGFLKYIPFIGKIPIPGVSMFRYWGRSVILLNLAVATLGGWAVSKLPKINFSKILEIGAFIAGYVLILEVFSYPNPRTIGMLRLFLRDDYVFEPMLLIWILIFALTAVFWLSKRYRKYVGYIVILDLLVFGKVAMDDFFVNKSALEFERQGEFENVRVLDSTGVINGDTALFYDFWGLLGYSMFAPNDLYNYLQNLGFKNARTQSHLDDLYIKSDVFKAQMSNLGVEKIITNEGVLDTSFKDTSVIKKEGYYKFNTGSQTKISTRVKYDPGWVVAGAEIMENSGYIDLQLFENTPEVELRYVPKPFLNALPVSLGLLGLYFIYERKYS